MSDKHGPPKFWTSPRPSDRNFTVPNAADAVLHTAFVHDGSLVPDAVIALDRTAINTMIDGLAGSK